MGNRIILSPSLDEPGMGSPVSERNAATELVMASPLTAKEGSTEVTTLLCNDARNTSGADPPRRL